MNPGDTIYVVTSGNIDEGDSFNGAYATHQSAINACVNTANALVKDANENDDGVWTAVTDLDTYVTIRRSSKTKDEPYAMNWWYVAEVKLQE